VPVEDVIRQLFGETREDRPGSAVLAAKLHLSVSDAAPFVILKHDTSRNNISKTGAGCFFPLRRGISIIRSPAKLMQFGVAYTFVVSPRLRGCSIF